MAAKPPRGFSPLANFQAPAQLACLALPCLASPACLPACLSIYLSLRQRHSRSKRRLLPYRISARPGRRLGPRNILFRRWKISSRRHSHRKHEHVSRGNRLSISDYSIAAPHLALVSDRESLPTPLNPFHRKSADPIAARRTIASSLPTEIRTASHEDLLFRRYPRTACSAI